MTASDLSFVKCVRGSEILRRGSPGEPVGHRELLVAESEDDPGNALCPLLLPDRVDNIQGDTSRSQSELSSTRCLGL